jgi:NAD(P)H-hydrate epimerase
MRRIDESVLRQALPPRRHAAHKGDFGHLLLIGGGPGMPGAVRLAGAAALRSGAGRVTVATHPSNVAPVAAGCPELMFQAVERPADLAAVLGRVDAIAVGPGLGRDAWAFGLLEAAIAAGLPLVLDADALFRLADFPDRVDSWILTPHPGEAARMLGTSATVVQHNRLQALDDLLHQYGGTVVLKGAGTLVSSTAGPPWLCTQGNPGMAAPGMGDVLTGVIAGLLVQGLPAESAAVCGVIAHATAGDAAAQAGQRGTLASDLLPELRTCLNP